MKKLILLILTLCLSTGITVTAQASQDGANAGGGGMVGQPDNSYIVIEEGQCVTLAVPGIDLEKCSLDLASPQSGIEAWICPPPVDDEGNTVVFCNPVPVDDGEDDD